MICGKPPFFYLYDYGEAALGHTQPSRHRACPCAMSNLGFAFLEDHQAKLKEDTVFGVLFCLDGVPKGSRTPVTAVKGRCPRPLDDGDLGVVDLVCVPNLVELGGIEPPTSTMPL